jgi:hypothetical protein
MAPTGSLSCARTDHRARRTGPREHGRQAARSKRIGPARAAGRKFSDVCAASGGVLTLLCVVKWRLGEAFRV